MKTKFKVYNRKQFEIVSGRLNAWDRMITDKLPIWVYNKDGVFAGWDRLVNGSTQWVTVSKFEFSNYAKEVL